MQPLDMQAPASGNDAGAMLGNGSLENSADGNAAEKIQRQHDVLRLLALLGRTQFASLVPRGNGNGPMWVETFDPGDQAAVDWVARNDAEGRASYYSLSIVRDGLNKKATKADIVAARGLFVDIDPPKDGSAFDKVGALDRLRELPLPPSFVVDSGGGLQPVWLLDKPEPDLALVEGINRQLAAVTDGDHCFNIDRLLRIPGSLNTPDAKKAAAGRVPIRAGFTA